MHKSVVLFRTPEKEQGAKPDRAAAPPKWQT